jgi:hypothetical protein
VVVKVRTCVVMMNYSLLGINIKGKYKLGLNYYTHVLPFHVTGILNFSQYNKQLENKLFFLPM